MIRGAVIVLFLGLIFSGISEAQLSASEQRGRAIYLGEAGSGLETATASIQGMNTRLPASGFPCASCHGQTGQGTPERGAIPAELSRGALTRPYTVRTSSGRVRQPYTLSAFRVAVRDGLDPGGQALSEVMPRYTLTERQLTDLWNYLSVMDSALDPGLTDDTIMAAVITAAGPAGLAQRRLLEAFLADVNGLGGVHGRHIRFHYMASDEPPGDVFAVLVLRPDHEDRPHPAPAGRPLIAVSSGAADGGESFSLVAGTGEQASALRDFAAREWGVVRLADACNGQGSDTLILVNIACLDNTAGARRLLAPISVFSAIPPNVRKQLPDETFIAMPTPLSRVSPQAQAAFARTRSGAGTRRDTILAEADAYSVGVIFVETLMRSGRDVSRRRFVAKLRELTDFEGAFTPPLSFGINRNTGSSGVEVVQYSPSTGTFSGSGVWINTP